MTTRKKNRKALTALAGRALPRSWVVSVIVAAAVVGVTLAISATVNPLFDRAVHWDWVAGIAPVAFLAVLFSTRQRWI